MVRTFLSEWTCNEYGHYASKFPKRERKYKGILRIVYMLMKKKKKKKNMTKEKVRMNWDL